MSTSIINHFLLFNVFINQANKMPAQQMRRHVLKERGNVNPFAVLVVMFFTWIKLGKDQTPVKFVLATIAPQK